MHEVGHTLGLRHNFRASTVYTRRAARGPRRSRAQNGISGSVMEYNPLNIAVKGERAGRVPDVDARALRLLGDRIRLPRVAPERRRTAELAHIAARSDEPLLAFATDEEVLVVALDPDVNTFDLGADPLAYAAKRLALVRELWQRTETSQAEAGRDLLRPAPQFHRAASSRPRQGAVYATKYVGGLYDVRDRAGTRPRAAGADAAVDRQRAALKMLATEVFSADSFRFSPAFLRSMAHRRPSDIDDAEELGRPVPSVDVPIDQQVLGAAAAVLSQLMGDTVIAQRLLNNEAKVDDPSRR